MTLRNIPFSPPDITDLEIREVIKALKSGWITTGPKTKLFEKRLSECIGVHKAVCLNSATAGMELVLRVLGVGPGDEVITTAYTYTSTASIIEHVGAKIILIDTAPNSYEMDYKQLEEAITEKTKVIIPVDIAGIICDYESIYEIIERKKTLFTPSNDYQQLINRIIVMADSAHAFGATKNNYNSGQIADFTVFSFHAVKNLTTAEGGAVVWRNDLGLNDDKIYQEFMLYSLHGQSKDALSKNKKGSWEYDILYPGYKYNMTDITSSIGLVQLDRYKNILDRRHEIIKMYDNGLKDLNVSLLSHSTEKSISSGHLYFVKILDLEEQSRNLFIKLMADLGVATNVHYKPLPMFTAYQNLGFNIEEYPNSYNMYKNEITLPLHTLLSDDDVEYVIDSFVQVYNRIVKG